ncbi:MAG: hypothetical protein ACLPN5_15590 [Roseiarcus sp.]
MAANARFCSEPVANYLCTRNVLLRCAEGTEPDDLVGRARAAERREKMRAAIDRVEAASLTLGRDPWSADARASEAFLPAVFAAYSAALGIENRMNKANFHTLTEFVAPEEINPDIVEALDRLAGAAPGGLSTTSLYGAMESEGWTFGRRLGQGE